MAPKRAASVSASESEDDTPETFSFTSSKRAVKGAEHALQQLEAEAKRKRKEANRARDRRLKEQAKGKNAAATHKGKGKQSVVEEEEEEEEEEEGEGEGRNASEPPDELEARMERAMREAEQESDEKDAEEEEEWGGIDGREAQNDAINGANAQDGSSDEHEVDDEEEPEGDGDDSAASEDAQDSEASASGSSESNSEDSGSEKEEDTQPTAPDRRKKEKSTLNYLPDHFFKTAFSTAASASTSKRRLDADAEDVTSPPRKKQRKRVKSKRPGKDITVGSRTIRTLAPANPVVPTAVPRAKMPPTRVNKFLSRSLNLKGKPQPAKLKGWERRSANVGVMKRNGPAASFVRNSD